MYRLEKLEIHGFKSFCDRTEVVFPERTTAVVGPNGCGKSNISDAIHWVLGEQRVRTLRGEKMEDVIFNGSERRKPLGLAEVSLFLSRNGASSPAAGGNGDGPEADLPRPVPPAPNVGGAGSDGDAAASPEEPAANGGPPEERWPESVRITRRLFRDGLSEYLIDGNRCRLRDIQDLLQRLSVGSGASSVIEQGKVEQIVASKPRERRTLIEEAAGIAGFRAKKREATLKLEATEANLIRLEDILHEVERQIRSIRRQAAKARRYSRLMEDRRRLERVAYHHRSTALGTRLADLVGRRAGVLQEEGRAAAESARAEADVERMRAGLEDADRRVAAGREAVHALELQVDREDRGVAAARKQAAELEAAARSAEEEGVALGRRAAELEAELAAGEAAALAASLDLREMVSRAEAAEAALAARQDSAARDETALEERRRGLLALLDVLGDLRDRLARLREDSRRAAAAAERARAEAREAAAERGRLAEEIAGLDAALDAAARRTGELETTRDRWTRSAEEGRAALRDAERRGEEARVRLGSLRERLTALQAQDREDSPQARALRAAGGDARAVLADRVFPAAEAEAAAEAFLAELLPAVLLPDPEAAREALARLREGEPGRASFVVPAEAPEVPPLPPELRQDPRVRGRLDELLQAQGAATVPVHAAAGAAVLVADLEAALDLARRHPGHAFVTPQGEVVRPGGLVSGGREADAAGGMLALRRRVQEATEEIRRAEVHAEATEREARERRQAVQEAERHGSQAQQEWMGVEVTVAETRERRRAAADRLEAAALRDRVRTEEAEREAADARRWETEAAEAAVEREAAERRRAALEAEIREAGAALERLRGEVAAASEEAADLRARREAARGRLEALAAEAFRVRQQRQDLGERAERAGREAAGRRGRAEDLQELARRTEESLRQNLERLAAERSRLAAAGETADEERRRCAARAGEARQLQAALEEVRARRGELDVALSRAESERDFLERSCRSDLGQSLADAVAAVDPTECQRDPAEVTADLERVRARIDGLGPVNVLAADEFTQLEERHRFLVGQREDLLGSVRSLRETIARISRRSRERFQEAYEAVRGNFQETFRLLFDGGRADLHLEEDAEDLLECGVEITAQPPGKRLQRIALLSGGEKALTAIALLFALFRFRPSPFCILDEVDAPLDEVNIGRYTELLRRLAAETQFVLITHNKRTMEKADVLYGVTMEEPGVSRLVSVRFRRDGRLTTEDGAVTMDLPAAPAGARRPEPPAVPPA